MKIQIYQVINTAKLFNLKALNSDFTFFKSKYYNLCVPIRINKLFHFQQISLKQRYSNNFVKDNLKECNKSGKLLFNYIFSTFKDIKTNFLMSFIYYGESQSVVPNEFRFFELDNDSMAKFKIKFVSLGNFLKKSNLIKVNDLNFMAKAIDLNTEIPNWIQIWNLLNTDLKKAQDLLEIDAKDPFFLFCNQF